MKEYIIYKKESFFSVITMKVWPQAKLHGMQFINTNRNYSKHMLHIYFMGVIFIVYTCLVQLV